MNAKSAKDKSRPPAKTLAALFAFIAWHNAHMPHPNVRIFLVRHGEVDANVEYRFLGRRDDPLNDTGRRQAQLLSSLFVDSPVAAVVSSPLQRTRMTAEAITVAAGVELRLDSGLRELDFGRWEGLTRSEIRDLGPAQADLLSKWDHDPSCAAPDGESLVELQARAVAFADTLLEESWDAPVVVVSHMGPIKTLLCAALGLSPMGARRVFLDPATVSVVDWSAEPVVRLVNSHAHLGWSNARWMAARPPSD